MFSMEKTATDLIKTPIFISSPRNLQEIACSQCALNCWRISYSLNYDQYPDETAGVNWFTSFKCVSTDGYQKLPKAIEKFIDSRTERMGQMLYVWAQKSFGDSCRAMILNCFDNIILNASGDINYKLTAKNLLTSDVLNAVEKYRIACWWSFEEDVERLWSSVKDDETIQGCSFDELPTMYYWNCRMKNELHKIPGDKRYSAESRMLSSHLCDWSETEYFWNKLSSREQLSKITDTRAGVGYINQNVLPTLDFGQLSYILSNLPVAVVENLAIEGENTRFAEQAWNCVANIINGDQFYELLYDLHRFAFSGECSEVNHVAVFLYEIWASASDNLQKCILDCPRCIEAFFDDLEEGQLIQSYGYDISFLVAVFNGAKFQLRIELWRRNWHKLIVLARPSDLRKFMELSFENEASLVKFKETEMIDYSNLNYEFDSFIKRGLCSELVDYLEFCSSDKERVRHLRMQIVDSNIHYTSYYFDPDMVSKFNNFIDDTFECPSLASRYKERFVLENIDEWYEMVDSGWLINVKNAIQCLLPEGILLSHIKRALYEHWQYNLRVGTIATFYIRHWHEFSNWCAPSEEVVLESKYSFNLDYLLGVLLPKCIREEWVLPPYFSRLDRFLRWYFVSEEATNEFKLQRINNYEQVPVIKKILEKGIDRDISRMLNWFFNFDADKVGEFRLKLTKS
ncbi:uncharacterized protein LOC135845688 [Planococcus citri]|uniref:uncharacterized protein LOC135845688 n=1 Tax=Planococcus citri TaxID=170843 RepID=UPI0031F7A0BE